MLNVGHESVDLIKNGLLESDVERTGTRKGVLQIFC